MASAVGSVRASSTVIVSPSGMNGWGFFDDNGNGGTGNLVFGPGTPPLGAGSAHLAVSATNQGYALGAAAYTGTPFSTITSLSYNTYRTSGASALAVSLAFNVDYDVTDGNTAYQGRLTFEPYYTDTVVTGSWQSWDTLATGGGAGNWWASNVIGAAACPISNPCTWTEVLTAFPNIGVHSVFGAVVLKAGSGWASFDGNVDALTIGIGGSDTTYDFEPECTTTCYVNTATGDDTFSGATPGSAKKTIQAALTAVSSGGTVSVAGGTYVEVGQIVINKDVSIIGAGAGTTVIKPSADTASSGDARGWFLVNPGFTFNLSHATLDGSGRKVWQAIRDKGQGTISDCAFTNIKFEESGPSYAGTGIAVFGSPAMNVDVTNCAFSGIGRVGVLYFGSGVTGSTFSGNTYTGKGAGDWLDYAVEVGAGAAATISRNTISDNTGVASVDSSTSAGILVSTFFGAGTTADITENFISDSTTGAAVGFDAFDTSAATVSDNSFTGNTKAVESSAPLVDASGNWWGSNTPAGVAGQVSTNVDYSPWLHAGTDTDGGTAGFQGDFSVLHVDNDSPQAGAEKHIQEGIGLVSGSTVLVEPGTYDETLNIDGMTDLTVDGTNQSLVTIKPTTTLPWGFAPYGSSRQAVARVVNSTDVVLQHMTMDFDNVKADGVYGVLYWNSTGELSGNTLKNMSVQDTLSGGYSDITGYFRATAYTDSARAPITISGNEFIDPGRLAIVTHDYVDATITGNTIHKTTNDFGYGMEIGSQSEATVTGNTIYGYDTPALSDGSVSGGIYVENAFTGGFFPLVTGVTKDVTVSNNEVYGSQLALVVGNEFDSFAGDVDINLTLQSNDFHDNIEGATVITDEDKENGSSVSVVGGDNTLTNNGPYGHFIYTQGDGDLTVDLQQDYITGNDEGVHVEDTAGGSSNSSYSLAVTQGTIAGNSLYGMNNTVTGVTVDAENNWWGACDGPSGVGPGSGDAVSTGVDYDPWEKGKCDDDNDLLTNDEEDFLYGTNPSNPDTDGDGCADGEEVEFPVTLGGGRDPLFFWDFFDVPTPASYTRDKAVSVADVSAVVARFGSIRPGGPPNKTTALAEAQSPPPAPPAYHAAYDRTAAGVLTGPPDGAITIVDINRVVAQFGHSCIGAP